MLVSCNRLLHGSICCCLFVVWLHPEGTLQAVEEWDREGAEGDELRARSIHSAAHSESSIDALIPWKLIVLDMK